MTSRIPRRPLARGKLEVSELGFGCAPLGNLYRSIEDAAARGAVERAIEAGINFFDTAPYYGFGLSERRLGDAVRGRTGIVVSTKVGRLLRPIAAIRPGEKVLAEHALPERHAPPEHALAEPTPANPVLTGHTDPPERHGFRSAMPFEPVFDYSYDGVMRSWEHSLHRLGLAHVSILLVHDIGRLTHRERHPETFGQLIRGGGLRALEELRSAGAISAFGLGVNEYEVALEAMDHADLDVVLLAGRYTLLEQGALKEFLPSCAARNVSVVIGGAYNSGILATGTRSGSVLHYNYDRAGPEIVERVRRIEEICDRHGVRLPAAALHFPLAHPAVSSVVVGLDSLSQVAQTLDHFGAAIPLELWSTLRREGLLPEDAPTPDVSTPDGPSADGPSPSASTPDASTPDASTPDGRPRRTTNA